MGAVIWRIRFCMAAATAAAIALGLAFGAGSAWASEDGPQISLNCQSTNGVILCRLASDRQLDPADGVQFTIEVGDDQQTVTSTAMIHDTWRTDSNCGADAQFCYRFIFTPEHSVGGPVETVPVSNVEAVGPCDGAPSYMCTPQAPEGSNVVAIHNDGEQITLDRGNNGPDDTDEKHNYDASNPPTTREEVEDKQKAREAVANIPPEDTVVITAANGHQSSSQQENAFSLEQELWERGEPYVVCFDPITYTNSQGEEITVEPDCVTVTPY